MQIGIDRAEREGCLLPERQEDGSRRKQKIIFYMKGWLGQFTRNYTQTTKRGLLTTNKG